MSTFVSSTPRGSSRFQTIVPLLAGIAAGVVSSLLLHRQPAPAAAAPATKAADERASEPSTTSRSAPQVPAADPAIARRLGVVEQRLAEMGPKDDVDGAPRGRPDEAERQAQNQRLVATFAGRIKKHEDAPVDAVWAKASSASLGAAMTAAAQANRSQGELKAVDCRTDSCLATLEFPSFDAARDGYAGFVTGFYAVNCTRTAVLDPPEDPSVPYSVQMIFEGCKRD